MKKNVKRRNALKNKVLAGSGRLSATRQPNATA
jgi:hypothetical protein